MSRKEELVAKHIELYKDDWEFLLSEYGRDSANKLGAGRVVRAVVRSHVKALRELRQAKLDRIPREGESEAIERALASAVNGPTANEGGSDFI